MDAEHRASPGVQFRLFFQEAGNGNFDVLNFDGDYTWPLQEAGRRDAQTALELGQDKIQQRLGEWLDSNDLQRQYPNVYDYIRAPETLS